MYSVYGIRLGYDFYAFPLAPGVTSNLNRSCRPLLFIIPFLVSLLGNSSWTRKTGLANKGTV